MGKTNKKKKRVKKPRPTGLESVAEVEKEVNDENEGALETEASRQASGTVTAVLEKLQSGSADERECGCTTIASLVNQPGAIPIFLEQNAVRILGPLMVDPSVNVRESAVGALRNLSVGSFEVCDEMVDADIMTPLVAILQEYREKWQPERSSAKVSIAPKSNVFLQATHLLRNLCESNQTAVTIVNQQNLISMFLPCLDPNVYGFSLAIAVAQLLQTVSESNPDAINALTTTEAESILQMLIANEKQTEEMEHIFLKTLTAGILYNVSCGKLNTVKGTLLCSIINQLASTIQIDTKTPVIDIADKLTAVMSCNGFDDKNPEEHLPEVNYIIIDKEISRLQNVISAQQLALEIVTNLCCCEDEEWNDLDSGESSADEVAIAESQANEMDMLASICVSSEVLGLFSEHHILEEVVKKISAVDGNVAQVLMKYPKARALYKSLTKLQNRALNSINNMATNMDPEALGGLKDLHLLWLKLTQLAVSEIVVQDEDILEAVTSAMRAVVQRLGQLESPEFKDVTAQNLTFLFEMGLECKNAGVRANTLRIVSTIGCMLSKDPLPHPLLKNIGTFLLELASKDTQLWVVAESLDAIFDVFAEDHVDPIAKDISLVPKLKQIAPSLKLKYQQQRKQLGEHLPIVTTARTNLTRFIKYKNG